MTLVGACDKAQSTWGNAARYGIRDVFIDYEEMIQSCKPDIVDICSPPESHYQIARYALESGCHVLVEKPFTTQSEEARQLVQIASDNGLRLCVIQDYLYRRGIRLADRILKHHEIGQIHYVQIVHLENRNDTRVANPRHWVHKLPLGELGDILPHSVYTLEHFSPNQQVIWAHASPSTFHRWTGIDNLSVSLQSRESLANIYITSRAVGSAFEVTLIGENYNLFIDSLTASMYKGQPLGGAFAYDKIKQVGKVCLQLASRLTSGSNSTHFLLIKDFLTSLRGGHDILFDNVQSVHVCELQEAIERRVRRDEQTSSMTA